MAIKKSIRTEFGFDAPDCYFVIVALDYQKDGASMISVAAYRDVVARNDGTPPFKMLFFTFVPNINGQQNLISQAYNHLKTVSEFSNSVDV